MAAAIALPGSILVWRYTELRCTVGAMLVPGILPAIIYMTGWVKHNTWEVSAAAADRMVGLLACLILVVALTATGELKWLHGHLSAPALGKTQES